MYVMETVGGEGQSEMVMRGRAGSSDVCQCDHGRREKRDV